VVIGPENGDPSTTGEISSDGPASTAVAVCPVPRAIHMSPSPPARDTFRLDGGERLGSPRTGTAPERWQQSGRCGQRTRSNSLESLGGEIPTRRVLPRPARGGDSVIREFGDSGEPLRHQVSVGGNTRCAGRRQLTERGGVCDRDDRSRLERTGL
jgi:hypothetical protein